MKHLVLYIFLFSAIFSFAQSETEQTKDGYRIIHILSEEELAAKDSAEAPQKDTVTIAKPDTVVKVEIKSPEEKIPTIPIKLSLGGSLKASYLNLSGDGDYREFDEDFVGLYNGAAISLGLSALIPLNPRTEITRSAVSSPNPLNQLDVAIKIEALYKFGKLTNKENFTRVIDGQYFTENQDISQQTISFPTLLAIKYIQSSLLFELGFELSIPISDQLGDEDLIEEDFRTVAEKYLLFGLEYFVNDKASIQFLYHIQLNDAYTNAFCKYVQDLVIWEVSLGFTYYFLPDN